MVRPLSERRVFADKRDSGSDSGNDVVVRSPSGHAVSCDIRHSGLVRSESRAYTDLSPVPRPGCVNKVHRYATKAPCRCAARVFVHEEAVAVVPDEEKEKRGAPRRSLQDAHLACMAWRGRPTARSTSCREAPRLGLGAVVD